MTRRAAALLAILLPLIAAVAAGARDFASIARPSGTSAGFEAQPFFGDALGLDREGAGSIGPFICDACGKRADVPIDGRGRPRQDIAENGLTWENGAQTFGSALGLTANWAGIMRSGYCFIGGTLVETPDGQIAIQALEVGDRVLTDDPETKPTAVDPATWRKVTVRMPNPHAPEDRLDIVVLRSPEWIESMGCESGETLWFAIEELGLEGPATIQAVEAVPPLEDGPGRVVLATLNHLNGNVHRLTLAGGEVIEPTGAHRLYSTDRNDWVRTSDLEAGESLRTRDGPIRLEAIARRPGVHRVYNIEVESDHRYFVGDARVLSHNADCVPAPRGERTYVTYTADDLDNPGKIYTARASGPSDKTPLEILRKRKSGHHRNLGELHLDQMTDSYAAIRGREHLVRERLRAAARATDQINPIGPRNDRIHEYLRRAIEEFGEP